MNETVIAEVGCLGRNVTEFVTSSPLGMTKTTITTISPGQYPIDSTLTFTVYETYALLFVSVMYAIRLLWTPVANQYGPQIFCAAAFDNTNVQSAQWCIIFLAGFIGPNLQAPLLVQGSASPVGTVFSNHTLFSIQSK